jgi:uncharacterized cofD-like protein
MQNNSFTPLRRSFRDVQRWLYPGLGVKRWLLFVMSGVTLLGLGLGVMLIDVYHNDGGNSPLHIFLNFASLNFLPRFVRLIIFGIIGGGLIVYGLIQFNRSLLSPFIRPGSDVFDQLATFRRRDRGPRIVGIGGGHGLATLLRGLRIHTGNLTAVVTVADDGGSSGRLRERFGILPPGDIRNCLAALSNDEALLTQLFQYRFSDSPGLEGHSFGNLFITALADITGSFEAAIVESGRVLSVNGRVLPSTLHDVKLTASVNVPDVVNEIRVRGESKIPETAGQVRHVWLEPDDAPAFPPVIKAILNADVIVIGPGSLYTSILPNLLVQDLLAAIHTSRALKIFVCNIVTQAGETDAYTSYDHLRGLERHIGEGLFDVILCNDNYQGEITPETRWVHVDEKILSDPRAYCTDLVNDETPWRHDSTKLAQVIMNIFYQRTKPLRKSDMLN